MFCCVVMQNIQIFDGGPVMFMVTSQEQKCPFWANLVPKFKIVSLSWNLVSRLMIICRNHWCTLFRFLTGNTFFGANLVPKLKIVCLKWNLEAKLIWTCRIQWWCSSFPFLTCKFFPKTPAGILILPDQSISLLAETWSQWFFLV